LASRGFGSAVVVIVVVLLCLFYGGSHTPHTTVP
jgi:hypothetical protein